MGTDRPEMTPEQVTANKLAALEAFVKGLLRKGKLPELTPMEFVEACKDPRPLQQCRRASNGDYLLNLGAFPKGQLDPEYLRKVMEEGPTDAEKRAWYIGTPDPRPRPDHYTPTCKICKGDCGQCGGPCT